MIISHRGFHKNIKENTLAAFDAAFQAGAQAVECDLRLIGGQVASHIFRFPNWPEQGSGEGIHLYKV